MNDRENNIKTALSNVIKIKESKIDKLSISPSEALKSIVFPLAFSIQITLPGLNPQKTESGHERYLNQLHQFLKYSRFIDSDSVNEIPRSIIVTTEGDKTIVVSTVKNLGNFIGYVAAIMSQNETSIFPFEDTIFIITSQLESRINQILAPGSELSHEYLQRRLLQELKDIDVVAVARIPVEVNNFFLSAFSEDEKIEICSNVQFAFNNVELPNDGDLLTEDFIPIVWPGAAKIAQAIWIKASSENYFAFGFKDKKSVSKSNISRLKKQIDKQNGHDIEYLVHSFEKLKKDLGKLIKSERAAAITETAVTVNHEINNPLTAILGNTQLLLMSKEQYSEDMITKLKTIEKSAIRIRETTAKLMKIIDPVRTHYASGLNMIDIEQSKKKDD